MRRRIVLFLAFALGAALPFPPGGSALAHEGDEERLERVEAELQNQRALLQEANRNRLGLIGQIAASDARRTAIADRIEGLIGDLAVARARLGHLQEALDDIRLEQRRWDRRADRTAVRLEQRQSVLSERAATAYKLGPAGFLDIILGSTDVAALADRAVFVEEVLAWDAETITGIDTTRSLLEGQKARVDRFGDRFAARWRAVRREARRIARLKAEQEALRAAVDEELSVRRDLLDDVEESRARYEAAVAALEAESQAIEALLDGTGSTGSGTGELFWPTQGPITSGFGWREHPIWRTKRFHAGVDIDGDCGQSIFATESGTVVTAGWRGGYGLATVIDHGNGLATLYAHQSGISASPGERVGRAERIGAVGTTGWSTGCHLHFEVRVNGSPVDPVPYLS